VATLTYSDVEDRIGDLQEINESEIHLARDSDGPKKQRSDGRFKKLDPATVTILEVPSSPLEGFKEATVAGSKKKNGMPAVAVRDCSPTMRVSEAVPLMYAGETHCMDLKSERIFAGTATLLPNLHHRRIFRSCTPSTNTETTLPPADEPSDGAIRRILINGKNKKLNLGEIACMSRVIIWSEVAPAVFAGATHKIIEEETKCTADKFLSNTQSHPTDES
jgi:hypothetical protein